MSVVEVKSPGALDALRTWSRRRWIATAIGAVGTFLLVGASTAMIPTPIFGRAVPTTWWAWPVLAVTSVLAGLLGATYVRRSDEDAEEKASKAGMIGGMLSWFAVGCPVCNKIVLLALGYTGALQWFAPVQPLLGVAGLGLLAYALYRRLKGEIACPA